MATIIQGSEEKLIDMVRELQLSPDGWLCIHYHLSKLSIMGEEQHVKIALNTFTSHLKDVSCNIFVCPDKDIFVFSRTLKNKVWEGLTHKLRQLFADDKLAYNGAKPNPDFFNLYSLDIKDQLDALLDACNLKLENKKPAPSIDKPNLPKPDTKILFDHMVTTSGKKRRIEREGLQILVVEDDAFSRKLVSSVLEKEFDTITARNGSDALQTYAIHYPDLVFLDIQMPDLNGHEVLKEILAHDPDAYIVMLSANSYQKEVISSMKEGAKGFVVKPFKKDKIWSYIDKYKAERKPHA